MFAGLYCIVNCLQQSEARDLNDCFADCGAVARQCGYDTFLDGGQERQLFFPREVRRTTCFVTHGLRLGYEYCPCRPILLADNL